jgi:excisionase family DNA binding protein
MDRQTTAAAIEPALLTSEEAARRLGISRSRLYLLMGRGELESVKIGRTRRIPTDSVDALVARWRDEQA